MLFILDVQLPTLQVNVVHVKVVVIQLHMDHLLTLLIHFVFFKSLVDLVDLALDFGLVLLLE